MHGGFISQCPPLPPGRTGQKVSMAGTLSQSVPTIDPPPPGQDLGIQLNVAKKCQRIRSPTLDQKGQKQPPKAALNDRYNFTADWWHVT